MGCQSEVTLGDNLTFSVCVHDPTSGALTDADSAPAYRVYETETGTAILSGTMAVLDDGNTTGFYTEEIACTTANGFEAGKSYSIYIAATVDGVTGGIAYGFRAAPSIYTAKVWMFDDDSGARDRYVAVWYKDGVPVVAGITTPLIQVIKLADGTDLVASTAMSEAGTTEMYYYNEATNRMVDGAAYMVKITATIDGAARTWYQPCGRDSTA
jgi:hypothetical protein